MWIKMPPENSLVVYDGYVKYEEAAVDIIAFQLFWKQITAVAAAAEPTDHVEYSYTVRGLHVRAAR